MTQSIDTNGHAANGSRAMEKKAVVCVFCGASPGTIPAHLAAARKLGQALHANNMDLVYGGGTAGMMGEVARTLVNLSGPEAVHGIIPEALVKYEQEYDPKNPESAIDAEIYGRTTIVKDMHTRKTMMAKEVIAGGRGSGFVALSGGYGTLEELMEVTTWNQLGIHDRPIVMFNVHGYWDGIISWVNNAVESGFIAPGNATILVEAKSSDGVINSLTNYKVSEARLQLNWDNEG